MKLLRLVLLNLACGAGVFAIATFTLTFLTGPDGMMMPMWPGSAVALAILWLAGLRVAPGLMIGLAVSTIVTNRVTMLPSVGVGSVLEGIVGISLLRLVEFDVSLRRMRDAILLMLVVTTAGPMLTGAITLATTSLFLGPLASPETAAILPAGETAWSFGLLAARFTWAADGVGTLLIAPTVLVWAGVLSTRRRGMWASRARVAEALVLGLWQLTAMLMVCGVIEVGPLAEEYLLFPGLFWAALRFGPAGATLLTCLTQVVLIAASLHGRGPFAQGGSLSDPVTLQLFAVMATASGFLLATTSTERQRASEEAGRLRAEARLAKLVEHITDMILVVDTSGEVTFSNAAVRRVLGLDEVIGLNVADVVHPDALPALRSLADADGVRAFVSHARHSDGHWVPVEAVLSNRLADAEVGGLVLNMRDITERQQAEVELRNAQKLESVGRLAAGIAHEINTPIQFIGDNLHFLDDAVDRLTLALDRSEANADLQFLLREMPLAIEQSLEGVRRVASTVRGLREFAQPDCPEQADADLNKALLSVVTVARSELERMADVETALGDLPPVRCHQGDLNQVFLQLLINAAHAIADRGDGQRGRIRLSTHVEDRYAVLRVSDTGCGIPESIRGRVFDPFFTTKDVGRGTGQGLALARSIVVDKHGGSIDFNTRVGRGTTFTVRLPIDRVGQTESSVMEAA